MTRRCVDLLVFGALLIALAGCRTCPEPRPAPSEPCLVEPPPAVHDWAVVDEGCPPGLVCLTDNDARAVAYEVEARREWDARAWARCGEIEHPRPGEGLMLKESR